MSANNFVRGMAVVASILLWLVVLVGGTTIAAGVANFYMVYSGQAIAGDIIFLDELALPLSNSAATVFVGLVWVILAITANAILRRKLGGSTHNSSSNADPLKRSG
jgi:hypothetical protein